MYLIYARQSVDKKDSISIEMQIELCKNAVPRNKKLKVFQDRGFSGTNTKRPGFQQMIDEIKLGNASAIVVYKLDRISRSLVDFARLLEELEEQNVKLFSCSEGLDTKTPMGQMLVKLLIMFAEMEQKMISARIRDNYHARAEKMMPLGGKPPFGFDKNWLENIYESFIVRECYRSVILGESLEKTGRKFGFTGTKTARIIRNTAYVMGNTDVIRKLIDCGHKMWGKEIDFRDGFGIISIKSQGETYIAPGSHKGFIEAEIWLSAQEILESRKPSSNGGSSSTTYLAGLILCGKCGSSCYIRDNGKGRPYLYITCQGKRKGVCDGFRAMRLESVESYVTKHILNELQTILNDESIYCNENCSEIVKTEAEILKNLANCEESCPEKIFALDRKRDKLIRKNSLESADTQRIKKMWKEFTLNEKKAIARILIKNIIVTEEKTVLILR